MVNGTISKRALKREKKELSYEEVLKIEEKEIEKERKEFLEEILSDAQERFKDYEQGYRAFSVKFPKGKHFSIDDEIIDLITNAITSNYKCNYRSLSLTEVIYPKSYTFTFYKKNKK